MKKVYVIFVAVGLFILLVSFETIFEEEIKQSFEQSPMFVEENEEEINLAEETREIADERPTIEENTFSLDNHADFIGMTATEVIEEFGEPTRKDLSAYGYDWWIYPLSEETYMQIGIEQDEVVTVFMTGDFEGNAFSFGQTYQELNEKLSFQDRVDMRASGAFYQFELSDEDLRMRPLVELNDQWVQLYFDTFTGELSSIRMMTEEILLLQQPYSIVYRGTLPESPSFSEEEWATIEEGEARQIFDVTNMIRVRHGVEPLEWGEQTANVAYLHSKDMSLNRYFSHTSPTYGELIDRFENGDVRFSLIGENIAALYVDGVAAVEGWLNSEGHRVNLLHEEFTHLGVGVYRDHFTQNFMTP